MRSRNSACASRGVAITPPFGQFAVWRSFHGGRETTLISRCRNALVRFHSGTVAASPPNRGGVRTLPFRRLRNSFPAGLMRTLPSPRFLSYETTLHSRFT